MPYTRTNLVRFMVLLACGSVLVACGESDAGEPFSLNLVYCDNPDVAAPSCDLPGYTMNDDSALRAKLDGCATGGCHTAPSATSWTMNVSGSVQDALSALTVAGETGYYVIDDVDPDCSLMLSEVTDRPIGTIRMPVTGGYWSKAQTDCFRSYLPEMYPQ